MSYGIFFGIHGYVIWGILDYWLYPFSEPANFGTTKGRLVQLRILAHYWFLYFSVAPELDCLHLDSPFSLSVSILISYRQGYDISQDSVLQDLGLFFGFLKALLNVLRIKPRGLCWLAIPCNSFGWMAFSQHLRQWCNPYGCPLRPWVWQGNLLCSRACLLIAVAVCRGVTWFVENPLQSSIHSWPYLNYLMYNTWLNSRRTSW